MGTSQLRDEKAYDPFKFIHCVTVNESETNYVSKADETCIHYKSNYKFIWPIDRYYEPTWMAGKIPYRQYCKSNNQQSYENLCDITKKKDY